MTGNRRVLSLVVALALVIRIALLLGNIADRPWFFFQDLEKVEAEISNGASPYMNPFGFEASNIAHAWVCEGQGYSSPFGGSTGPTAWIAPGVVALYALSFALWGCFTFKSVLFAFFVALVCSAVTTVVVFRIGSRLGGDPEIGLLAALFFACLPFEAWIYQIAGHLDFNLQVLFFALLLLAVLRADDSRTILAGLELGSVAAVAALFNPGLLLCATVGVVYACRGRTVRQRVSFVLFITLACLLILGPYVVFQSLRLGEFVPVKSNAGFEVFIGNTAESRGVLEDDVFKIYHPSQNPAEYAAYREAGEAAYLGNARRRFREGFELQGFLENTLRRGFFFFIGYQIKPWDSSALVSTIKVVLWAVPAAAFFALAAIRRGRLLPGEGLVLLFTVAYSLPFLLTGVMERYRVPMVSAVAVVLALVTRELIVGWRRRPDRG